MRVSAYIHDFQAMDEASSQPAHGLQPRTDPAAGPGGQGDRAAGAKRPGGRRGVRPWTWPGFAPSGSRRSRPASSESAGLLERGQAAEAAGKLKVARLYYQMAYRKAEGDAKAQALARLEALSATQPPALAETGR